MSDHLTAAQILRRNAREFDRMALRIALRGSSFEGLNYALQRSARKAVVHFSCFGSFMVHDVEKGARLAAHWYRRLEKLASKCSA